MNCFRQALLAGKPLIGGWIQTASPVTAEIFAAAGYDWVAVDCEHSEVNLPGMTAIMRSMDGHGAAPFVRVAENDSVSIRQALDMGACGVIVPLVNNAEEAARAVYAAKYPPIGKRGFGFVRKNGWGRDFDCYAEQANDETVVIVMIESKEAVENIDAILEVDGVDGVFIGPYDMSGSYGCVGEVNSPVIQAACQAVADACRRHGRIAGQHIVTPTPELVAKAIAQGFSFLALGADIVFLRNSANQAVEMVRRVAHE